MVKTLHESVCRTCNRPKVSVCIASYNGEKFIEEQLKSILPQLKSDDEIVIVDDASKDTTRDLIASINDARIRLLVNGSNCGVLASFERALENASGDILFLSDQDDVWLPDKVSTVVETFVQDSDVMVVISDSSVIDENGRLIADSYYSTRTPFTSNIFANILHFRYHGCAMALRRAMLPEVFPFPRGFDVLHDVWIGLRTKMSGRKSAYLAIPLFQYRRHSANVSRTLPRWRQIRVRLHLVAALLMDAFRRSAIRRTRMLAL